MLNLMHIASTGLSASQVQLSTTANNLANMETTNGPNGQPYRAEDVLLKNNRPAKTGPDAGVGKGVDVTGIAQSRAPFTPAYDPTSPLANAKGDVMYPNVSLQSEMPNLIQASSAYSANATAFTAAKTVDAQALKL